MLKLFVDKHTNGQTGQKLYALASIDLLMQGHKNKCGFKLDINHEKDIKHYGKRR